MGYSHYYNHLSCNAELANAAKALISASQVHVCGGLGEGEPILSQNMIWFNGDEKANEEYEPFEVVCNIAAAEQSDPWYFQCTKTGQRPYDEVVTALLAWAIIHASDGWETIGSDGDILAWHAGIALYEKTFGEMSDEELSLLADVIGCEEDDSWWLDKVPLRSAYWAACEYANGSNTRRNLTYLFADISPEEYSRLPKTQIEAEHEALRMCSGGKFELILISDKPTVSYARFLNGLAELLFSRWRAVSNLDSNLENSSIEEAAAKYGLVDDVRAYFAGVPVSDVIA